MKMLPLISKVYVLLFKPLFLDVNIQRGQFSTCWDHKYWGKIYNEELTGYKFHNPGSQFSTFKIDRGFNVQRWKLTLESIFHPGQNYSLNRTTFHAFVPTRPFSLRNSSRNCSLIVRRKLLRVQIFLLFREFRAKFEFTEDLVIYFISYKAHFFL